MSASKQKKIRQSQNETGYVSEKEKKALEEKKANKRDNLKYIIIAVVFVIVAVALIFSKLDLAEKNAVAVEINGEKFNAAEFGYFYQNAISNVTNSEYVSYFGLDTSAAYDTQELNDTAKALLGVDDDEIVTWADYFLDAAEESIINTYAVYNEAVAQGKTYDEEVEAELAETDESLDTYAAQNGYNASQYIKMIYGKNMSINMFHKLLTMTQIASLYSEEYQNSLTFTNEELEALYEEEKDEFDVADYEYLYFSGMPEAQYDDEGNVIEATEEENEAAEEAAKANAEDAKARVEKGETLESLAEAYDNGVYTHEEAGIHYSSDMIDWVFDEARTAGEIGLIESDGNYYVVVFHSSGRNEYNTVNVRHILITADTSSLDTESETYDDDVAAIKEDAKATAEAIYEDLKDKTEDDFATQAKAASEDTGSAENGGLYEEVYKGQMVDTFNDWCFDETRKVGDMGIVETSYGYHVMYFSGFGRPYWEVQVSEDLSNHEASEWLEGLISQYTLTEGTGLKYVISED